MTDPLDGLTDAQWKALQKQLPKPDGPLTPIGEKGW